MFAKIFVPVAILFSATAMANDYRLLVQKSDCQGMIEFRETFEGYCPNFQPALAQGLQFQGAYFRPGDYKGQNNGTEALAFCTYKNPTTGEVIPQTEALLQVLGAKTVASGSSGATASAGALRRSRM